MSNEPIQPPDSSIRDPQSELRRPVNLRSVLLGLLGVLFICGLTPFNDWVVGNTFVVGNFLPIGLLLFFLVLIGLVNAPLHRFAPRWALGTGELAVVMGMMLVSSALPGSGLYRYLPAQLVGVWNEAGQSVEARRVLADADLPDWIYPKMSTTDPIARANDPVVGNFVRRAPVDEDTFANHWNAVPWAAWFRPLAVWGVLAAGIYGMVMFGTLVVRHQWIENERLSFPLASVYLSLIEAPERGNAFNSLFKSRGFWLAAGAVFLIHLFNGIHAYTPKWPEVPIRYDLSSIFKDAPWTYMSWSVKVSTIYFCVVGFAYFLSTQVGFSLWFLFLMLQAVAMMFAGSQQFDLTGGMLLDQQFGALVPFVLSILWVGRAHWAMILRQMFRGPRDGEPVGRYLPYAATGWGLVLSAGLVVAWLVTVGATFVGALVIVLMMSMLYLALARVVCETGLIFVQIGVPLSRPWVYGAAVLPAVLTVRTTPRTFLMTTMVHNMFTSDMRESLPAFATTAVKVADDAAYGRAGASWRVGFPLVVALALALGFAYVTAGASMLYTEYTYAAMIDTGGSSPINGYALGQGGAGLINPSVDYRTPEGTKDRHSQAANFAVGASITSALSLLRLRYAGWPLHPVGFLLANSYPMQRIWFSIFLGWLLKVLIVRFGGASLFRSARPVFIGLIIGEASGAAFWLVVSLLRLSMGLEYRAINLLPT